MPLQPNFLSETPRKVKTSSVPREVRGFDLPSLKESFHSELGDSTFDEGKLSSSYNDGDIIADCWLPDSILPVVPNDELLTALTGPDGHPLYNTSTQQWDPRYLPSVLQKVTPSNERPRLAPGQEEKELSTFMITVVNALIRHRHREESQAPSTALPTAGTQTLSTNDIFPSSSHNAPITSTPPPPPDTSYPNRSAERPPTGGLPQPVSPTNDSPPTPPNNTDNSSPSLPPGPTSASTTPDTSRSGSASAPGSVRGPKLDTPPRLWTSSHATQPLSGDFQLKPDSVLIRQPANATVQNVDWADVLMTAELTSRQQTLNLTSQIECRALAMFDAQPNRAFCYSLSFHAGQYRLYMYDRAGGVYSRSYDFHKSPLALLRILCAATFAPTSWLGMDDTFNCQLHPVITVDGKQYFIIARCFSSSVIRGRATTVWFVSDSIPPDNDENNVFVIKDSWVNVERQALEEEILESLKDIDCVPKVVKAWTIQRGDHDDSTSLRRPPAFMAHFNRRCDHRVRRRLVLTPAGRPITHAESPLEVVTCTLDLVLTHREIWSRRILHRDISINNSMMYEERLPDGTVRIRGLLIDFDYAIRVDDSNRATGPGDRTGTLPFMAIELLRTADNEPVQHTAAHDLESFVYLLCWVVTLYAGPQSQLRNDSPQRLAVQGWYEGTDLATFADNKEGCMSSGSHLKDITPYYESLRACIQVLSTLVLEQQRYVQQKKSDTWAAQAAYLTGSKRPRSKECGPEPLNHDAVILILHRTCALLRTEAIPESTDYPLGPYHYTKRHRTPLLPNETLINARSSHGVFHILDFGGGRYLKKRRIKLRKCGPGQTAQ